MLARIAVPSLALPALLVLGGCAKSDVNFDGGLVDVQNYEAGVLCGPEEVDGDADGDGIPNGVEDCLNPGADLDRDGTTNWQDWDSDGDGIPDKIEKGPKNSKGECASPSAKSKEWPCDHDGDGTPDYLDLDSDNDKLIDKNEDANGDGLIGCCISKCGKFDETWQKPTCIPTPDGCGSGQKCVNGACTPALSFTCSEGETSPIMKDTFGDGKLDPERGTFICREATEDNPKGRKRPQNRQSQAGDWNVAMEKTARYGELALANPVPKEAAATIDLDDPSIETAGLVLSKPTEEAEVQVSLQGLIKALQDKTPGGPGKVSVRTSGIQVKSHDRYDSVQGTILDLTLQASSNISHVRNEMLGALLGRKMADLGNLPGAYGSSGTDFVIRLVTVRRFAFKKDQSGKEVHDEKGYPIDDGDKAKWRLLVMGAVALRGNYQDPMRKTGFVVDDLSNGTGLAVYTDGLADACNVATITQLPVADIIWVIDESGSMAEEQKNVANNANNFFSRALASGLDFRMCVTDVCDPKGGWSGGCSEAVVGKCCSRESSDECDDGGTDRFLLPSEQSVFSACVQNPPGCEGGSEYMLTNAMAAVKKHLPRATNAVDRVRPEAKLVIIFVTDEAPEELKDAGIVKESDFSCQLDAAKKTALDAFLKPWLDLFTGMSDPEAAAQVHVLGGVCNSCKDATTAYGPIELAQMLGGQIGDICQADLGNTLQLIIDSIVGSASPVKLQYVPISSSLAVAMDGVEVPRSRTKGFDYRSSSNSVAFIGVDYKKGSEVITSYYRWKQQIIPQ
jgi:hypothetical protein